MRLLPASFWLYWYPFLDCLCPSWGRGCPLFTHPCDCPQSLQGGQGGVRTRGHQGHTCFSLYNLCEKVKVKSLSRVRLFATRRTVAYQAPPSVGSSRHESWSGLPFPSPGDLPYPGIEPGSPSLWADALPSEPHTFPCVCWVLSRCSHVRLCATLCTIAPARVLCPWDSPSKNTGVGFLALLQGLFPTQGSNPCL